MKRFFSLLIIALLIAMLSVGCIAESNQILNVHRWSVLENGVVQIEYYTPLKDIMAETNVFKLTLDGVEVPVDPQNIVSRAARGSAASWVFLIDTASLGTDVGNEPMRAMLPLLANMVGENDNATGIITGDTISTMELTSKKISDQLDPASPRMKSANKINDRLYDTVNAAVDFLMTDSFVNPRANLVIVSRATTDTGYAGFAQLQDKIANSGIMVHTIALTPDDIDPTALSNFTSLSESSFGGMSFHFNAASYSKLKAEEKDVFISNNILNKIQGNESHFFTLQAAPAAYGISGMELVLEVESKSNQVFRPRYTLTEEEQKLIQDNVPVEPSPSPTPTVEPTPTVVPTPTPNPFPIPFIPLTLSELIIAGSCLLLAIIILVVAIVISRRGREYYYEDYGTSTLNPSPGAGGPPSEPGGAPAPIATTPAGGMGAVSPSYPPDNWNVQQPPVYMHTPAPAPAPAPARSAEVSVTLAEVGGKQGVYSARMSGQLLIGRDAGSAQLVLPADDLKVSGSHLVLRYENGSIVAEDISRNGTLVNNVRIHQPTRLHQQDTLTLGTSRYRITWTNN